MTETGDRLHPLLDRTAAQSNPRRLTIWLLVALLLHAAAYLLLRITYPPAAPTRISEATLHILPPGSAEARRLAPYLAAADPSLFAPEVPRGRERPAPPLPAYKPSYAADGPPLIELPDPQPRIFPPLLRDLGPVPVADAPPPASKNAAPAEKTLVTFSGSLADRAPSEWPEPDFVARPGHQLAPSAFWIAIAPDGRVLHVIKDGRSDVLDDAASRYLMQLRFRRDPEAAVAWDMATFHWGLDVKREEPR